MNKKKTKINTILASVVSIGVLISIILIGTWGALRNKNTNLIPLKIAIMFFIFSTTAIGVAGGIYNSISARTNNEEVINRNVKDEDEGAIEDGQEDK